MDFIERLTETINGFSDIPMKMKMGYLSGDESLVIYPAPGSQVIREDYQGNKDVALNYEIAMASKSQQKIDETLWNIQNNLETLFVLESKDDSFEFDKLKINDKPYINSIDEQGLFIFTLSLTCEISILTK